ncbi:MAG: translocation/assembly module TamB domain-containing protein [Muribaculaceae bacterium]|nr:translocation/assembly module TamB domain-containing protein [Muribaculaceae bacterium]
MGVEDEKEKIGTQANPEESNKIKKHLIHPKWLRIVLKSLMWIIISVVCIAIIVPVLLYIPPVQTFVKNIALNMVEKSTGMKIGIDNFRLKWPLDVALDGVTVVEATGDTMVYAKEVIADVKLAPLFKLDIDVNELMLKDAGIRIMAPDSSMLLKLKASLIDVDDKSSVDIKTLDINLNKILVKEGDLSLYMDVWKKKPAPSDSTSVPLKISIHEADLQDFTFGMGMLPTIDTLSLTTKSVILRNGIVDLSANKVTADYIGTSDGSVIFITPTPEYVATHPLPVDSVSVAGAPMIIMGDTISVNSFKAVYAVKNARPLPGFDPSFIEVDNVFIRLDNFYNEASTVKLPITRLEAHERSGLTVTEGKGLIQIDSIGLSLKDVSIHTPFSELNASASVPFAMMEMKPYAPFDVDASGSVGWPDIESFVPDLKSYTTKLPARSPLDFNIRADGSLADIDIPSLGITVPEVLSLKASGNASNVLDIKKLDASITFDGSVTGPKTIDALIGIKDFRLPALKLTGKAMAKNENYSVNFDLETTLGSLVAKGAVGLNSEKYKASVSVKDFNVAGFMPEIGIGKISAQLKAQGAGFNPTKANSATDISLDVSSIVYNGTVLRDIGADITLNHGKYVASVTSPNEKLGIDLNAEGVVAPDLYTIDLDGKIKNIDLFSLGLAVEESSLSGDIQLEGNASPDKWLYEASLCVKDLQYRLGNLSYDFPDDIDLSFRSVIDKVSAELTASQTKIDFVSQTGLKELINSFTIVGDSIGKQIAARNLDIEKLQKELPPFALNIEASGNGAIGDFLGGSGLSVDTVYGHITNDSIIHANLSVIELANASMRADTLSLGLSQRGDFLDYRVHMGNRPNNPIADFADVNINGYIGENRLMLGLRQQNQKGETGYRLGLTTAFADSLVTVHFTPLKAMIGYIPWTFNEDNSVEVNIKNFRVDANLLAKSAKSQILLRTEKGKGGNDELHIALDNIHIQDFLNLSVFAPPITAALNVDLRVGYYDSWLYGTGNVGVKDFTYNKLKVGDFDLSLRAGRNDDGSTGARLGLKINGKDAMAANALLVPDSLKRLEVKSMGLELTHFPLSIANPFLGKDVAQLSGSLIGDFSLKGSFEEPKLNGYLSCDSVAVFIPMMGSSVKFNKDSVLVADNIIDFNSFDIWGANKNPITINGTVDINNLRSVIFNLGLDANNFQLMNNDSRARSDLYGKLFLNLHATARGPMEHFSINANMNLLSATDITYSIPQTAAQLTTHNTTGIVRFVNFADTTHVTKEDSVSSAFAMRIVVALNLEPGIQVNVIYPGSTTTGNARVELSPSGSLNYFQNYMGDMRLNGQIYLGNGYARYSMPIVGDKKFNFNQGSYVQWNGELLNPSFNISATDDVKASVIENGNSRIVNFLVEVDITNNLQAPKIEFNLDTDDDLTIRNELMSMTADQRSMAALNMLLTGQYTGNGIRTASSDLLQGTMYNLLTSQINGWLANNVRGVDISLGVDQYDRTVNGESSTSTSYSYTLSKSLFNNRFKISVGGNYTTDASADENFSENLINDISFEYILKQTQNVTMFVRLFRHTGYESILEGEITETGVGFTLRRRLATLKDLFKWGLPKFLRSDRAPNQGFMPPQFGGSTPIMNPSALNSAKLPARSDSIENKQDSVPVGQLPTPETKIEHNEKE